MASLQKRGKYYYGRWQKKTKNGYLDIRKSLGIRYKPQAREALETLQKLEEQGQINPFGSNFDPKTILKEQVQQEQTVNITTIRGAADYFYRKKSHLSNASVNNAKHRTMNNSGTYERVIEYFIKKNDIADLSPRLVKREHFERVIFRDIKPATMGFYFRSLRAWWNKLLEWGIVEKDYLKSLKKDLPKQKSNVRQKMMTDKELHQLFDAFDEDYKRKKRKKKFNDSQTQHWFKPLMSVYFYCGLRKHEAAFSSNLPYSGLKWQNIIVEQDDPVRIDLTATKGVTERSIPIPERCRFYLKEYLEIRGDLKYGDYLFVYNGTRRKGWPVTGSRTYREFKRYLKMAGLPSSRSLHGMRHQRITAWLEAGFNTSEVQFMAGHSNVKTTEAYTHLTGQHLLEKMRRMEKE